MALPGPLQGIRVLDLTSTFLGPYCTLQLSDLGADVVKVEPPTGDITRQLGLRRHAGMSHVFTVVNRGKRSVVLDLKTDAGRAALRALVRTADVLVHNLREGAVATLGMSYEEIRAERPDIVYCRATGFGTNGPYAGRP